MSCVCECEAGGQCYICECAVGGKCQPDEAMTSAKNKQTNKKLSTQCVHNEYFSHSLIIITAMATSLHQMYTITDSDDSTAWIIWYL